MKRTLLILAALLLCVGSLRAQTLEIEKPLTLTERQEAVKYERLDFNQVPCALVILHLDNDNVDFEGDIRTSQYRNGEWWIWMIKGSNWLTVKAAQCTPLRMEFKGLQSSKTYEVSLRPAAAKLILTEPLRGDVSMTDASNPKFLRRDAKGRTCAIVRIGLVLPEAQFQGNGVVHSEYRDGEWWVWLSPDATQMTVTAAGYQPLEMQFEPVQASSTYVMTLLKEGQQRVKRTDGYVDLGLPSGTLWKETDEVSTINQWTKSRHLKYSEALSVAGNMLPTKEQWEELKENCKWEWQGNGFKVTGPNEETLMLPASGYKGCDGTVRFVDVVGRYWSSTSSGSDSVWALAVTFGDKMLSKIAKNTCDGYSVRIVKPKETEKPQTDEAEEILVIDDDVEVSYEISETYTVTVEEEEEVDNEIYMFAEVMPEFPGGMEAYDKWFLDHLQYTDEIMSYLRFVGMKYTVYIMFVVERDGSLSGLRGWNNKEGSKPLVDEAIRTMEKMPKWKPAQQRGKPVRVQWTRPVVFDGTNQSGSLRSQVPEGYVDLGLPSGTLWKSENEPGIYSQTLAVERYNNQLPSKEQLEELVEKCTWKWENKGFTVTGPNGKSITLPADGTQNCYGENSGKKGVWGGYWSRTAKDSQNAWKLYVLDPNGAGKYLSPYSISNGKSCFGYSVRLVKSK